ncbi:TPA: phage tail assembly chaperone [Stenotrophomonas maltophilia]|nr:phage tail assembly chaperone [Stenotrophomonas maltophilia]
MTADLYAISESGYRAIATGMALQPGEVASEHVPPELLTKIKAEQMRIERGQRLRATDWTQMDDAPLTAEKKLEIQAYRQLLRDLPSRPGFPDVPWPQFPGMNDGAASGSEIPVTP